MPSLPVEVYRDIFEHLAPHDNRKALLASAQCSRLLREESQRILFRTVFLELWKLSDPVGNTTVTLHKSFLIAILGAPERLGPLVHSYSQYRVSCDAESAEPDPLSEEVISHTQDWLDQRVPVFNLTAEALHHMPNLKEFRFQPFRGDTHSSLLSSALGYTYPFQLEVFEWPYTDTLREAAFICAQRSLRHLNARWWRFRPQYDGDLGLQHRISPVLISTVGALGEFCVLAAGRDIVALEYWPSTSNYELLKLPGVSRPQDALERLKYIRVADYVLFLSFDYMKYAPTIYRIVMMEIVHWSPEEIHDYHHLPTSLQVLVLGNCGDKVPDMGGRQAVALTVFTIFPKLRYVYLCFRRRGTMLDAWCLSQIRRRGGLGDIHEEVVSFRHVSGDDWWREHLDVLDNIEHSWSPWD